MICRILGFLLIVKTANAMDILYTFDFDKLKAAEVAIKMTQNTPAAEKFLKLIPLAIRKPLDQDFLKKKHLEATKNYAREFKQDKKAIPVWNTSSLEEVHHAVLHYFSDPENLTTPEDAQTAVQRYLDTWDDAVAHKMLTIQEYVKAYNAYIGKMGPRREWLFKGYVDSLLGVTKEDLTLDSLEEKQNIFILLKDSGFLKTEIQSLKAFEYTPLFPLLHFMENHPKISSIVLGCGHHLQSEVCDALNIQREAFCGICNLTPNHHLDDLAIALSAHDIPDVVCDMNDPRLWDVLKTKKGGWKKIAEHSMYGFSIMGNDTLKGIYDSLSKNGIFEVYGTPSNTDLDRAKEAGFILKNVDEKKHLMFFKK